MPPPVIQMVQAKVEEWQEAEGLSVVQRVRTANERTAARAAEKTRAARDMRAKVRTRSQSCASYLASRMQREASSKRFSSKR